jgi:hypothetical protein
VFVNASAKVQRLYAEVTVADFLAKVFHAKAESDYIVTLKFKGNPENEEVFRQGYDQHTDPEDVKVDAGGNNYFCVSSFPDGFPARRKEYAEQCHVLVLDDPSAKADVSAILERLGQPTYKIQTSASDQWGFVFDVPPSDDVADAACQAINKLGLGDKAGNNRVRWVRLPAGINTKPSADNFKVRLTEWNPDQRLTVADMCAALTIKAGADPDGNQHPAPDAAFDLATAVHEILTAESFHDNLLRLAAHYVASGMKRNSAVVHMQELMNQAKADADPARWQARYDAIPKAVDSALGKGWGRDARKHTVAVAVGMIPEVVDALEPLLAELGDLEVFVYGGHLVEPFLAPRNGRRGADGKPTQVQVLALAAVTLPAFTNMLDRIARYTLKKLKDGKWVEQRVDVPDRAASELYGMPSRWKHVGVIERISEVPLLIDQQLVSAPGLHEGVWINAPEIALPVLTKKNAQAALARIETWLEEFPLEETDRAAAVALLMMAALRPSMDLAPGFVISKPEYGSGGSTLTDLASIVHCGRRAPVLSMTSNEEENRKIIESELHSGASFLNLDNLPDGIPFESSLLAQVLSQRSGKIRVLGKNKGSPEIPFGRVVILNGNNVAVGRDLSRRVLTVRLDPKMDHPEQRTFKRTTLLDDAAKDRESMLTDLFTIAAAYAASGERVKVSPLVGYEEFRERIAAALVWLERADVIASISTRAAPDETFTTLAELLPLWQKLEGNEEGLTVSDAFDAAGALGPKDCAAFRRLCAQVTKVKVFNGTYDLDPAQFGYWLRQVRDRVVEGHRFEHAGVSHKLARWRAACIETPCPTCDASPAGTEDGEDAPTGTLKKREGGVTPGAKGTLGASSPSSTPARARARKPDMAKVFAKMRARQTKHSSHL